ncbi:MAG: calcium-binding protein [Miltoncostaeaceae bacterium]
MNVRRRLLCAALGAAALAGGAVIASTGGAQGANGATEFFTWFGASSASGEYFSVVYDAAANPNETIIVERDGTTGRVRSRFGGGYIANGIATGSGRVYVAANDGTVRVYGKRAGAYRQIDSWAVSVPGQTDPIVSTGIVRAPGGYTLVAVNAQPPGLVPPVWLGVVVLDKDGTTVATWEVPAETVPANAFVLPIALNRAPSGEIFVNGIPCQAGLCGSPVQADGYLYKLALSKGAGGAATLTQTGRWASSVLPDVRSAAVLDAQNIITVGGGAGDGLPKSHEAAPGRTVGPPGLGLGAAQQYRLGGTTLTQVTQLRGLLNPATVSIRDRAKKPIVYMTENSSGNRIIIERFAPEGSGWARQGRPWRAAWGPAGPAGIRCAGRPATIVGTPGRDVIVGTRGPDVIAALGGADVVRAHGGNDIVCLGSGADRAHGGSGEDMILGENGGDRIVGGRGADILGGGLGPDVIEGGAGDDRLLGQPGRDVLVGGAGFDIARGGPGADLCSAERASSC